MPKQPPKRKPSQKRQRSLPKDYLTVDYIPPSHPTQPAIRGGTREPTSAERDLERADKAPRGGGR